MKLSGVSSWLKQLRRLFVTEMNQTLLHFYPQPWMFVLGIAGSWQGHPAEDQCKKQQALLLG